MDNRETLTPSSGDAILKRHLFSEVARNWIKGRGHIERAYFVRRPSRQSFGFRVAASSGPILKAPGSAGGYLPVSGGHVDFFALRGGRVYRHGLLVKRTGRKPEAFRPIRCRQITAQIAGKNRHITGQGRAAINLQTRCCARWKGGPAPD